MSAFGMTPEELEAAYGGASIGTNHPDTMLLTVPGMRELCLKTGNLRLWLDFVKVNLISGNPRLDPRRLPA